MIDSRFIVGIDLGTTNIAVTYIDAEKNPEHIQIFPIKQLAAAGECSDFELLPSFCYLPDPKQVPEKGLKLPWKGTVDYAVGVYARNDGSEVPNRFIFSAKSWLCHAGVDRNEKILPWLGEVHDYSRSPVDITQYYLSHIKRAWDHKFKRLKDKHGNPCIFEDQQVTITIPASFDETARELTLEAAKKAGYQNINLLEEPLSVFYAWLNKNADCWQELIDNNQKVLVIDIGGGTCDFSLVETDEKKNLKRTATGEHLLLGGDNIDIALARKIEGDWKTKLNSGDWSALCQKTREAKEVILANDLDETDVVLLAKGSSVIANMRKAKLKQSDLNSLLCDGFFPLIEIDSEPPRRKSTIQTMGLPYEPDPAVSRHLLDFLRKAARICEQDGVLCPDKVLFNGGTLLPDLIRCQIMKMFAQWFPKQASDIDILSTEDLQLAVAFGASYYGKTRRSQGVKVKSGTARTYYIKVQEQDKAKFICVMPRGIDENFKIESPGKFHLEANQKVEFPLYSSSIRLGDQPGDIIENDDELSQVCRLVNVIRFGKQEKKSVESEITAQLTETGVLHLWIESLQSDHKWPLKFDVRLLTETEQAKQADDAQIIIESAKIADAAAIIKDAFEINPDKLPSLFKILEKHFELRRQQWPLPLLRELADIMLDLPYKSLSTARKELRWLNLCGFCLRPGLGDPADEFRLKKAWKMWFHGANNPNDLQVAAEWWVFWRRIASGLKAGHQTNIYQKLFKILCPKGEYANKMKTGPQSKAEMWRCVGALELISTSEKVISGNILANRAKKLEAFEFWVLARLGTRRLFRAPLNNVVSNQVAEKWLNLILKSLHKKSDQTCYFALSRIAALSGERSIDVSKEIIQKLKSTLRKNNANSQWIQHLDVIEEETREEQAKILGDSLPLGLKLIKGVMGKNCQKGSVRS